MKVFLASSRESLNDMHRIAGVLEQLGCDTLTWDSPDALVAGTYTLAGIIEISRAVDAAIFIFAEDDKVWYRGSELQQPRDNVLVEFGLFAGTLGPERSLICRKGQAKLGVDIAGLVHVDISDGKTESVRARLEAWIRRLEQRGGRDPNPLLAQEFVRIVTDNRLTLDAAYHGRKYSARKVDILSIALMNVLEELATDDDHKMLNRVLFHSTQVRMMFLAPTSEFLRQRAIEDGDSFGELQARLRVAVLRAVEVYKRIKEVYEAAGPIPEQSKGFLEIRVIDFCPHFTVFRTDDSILWGMYTSVGKGLNSAVLQVQRSQEALFYQILQHFDRLWSLNRLGRAAVDSCLVKCGAHLGPPFLNEKLVNELLGGSWRGMSASG